MKTMLGALSGPYEDETQRERKDVHGTLQNRVHDETNENERERSKTN